MSILNIEIEQFKGTIYENGYGTVAKAVMKNKNISMASKALYAYLCSYAWGKNESYPTVGLITSDLGISERSFSKYRTELEESGYITVEFRNVDGQNRNVYVLNSTPENFSGVKNFTPSKNDPVKNCRGNNKRNTFKNKKGNLMEKDNQYKELTEDDLNSFEDGEWKL
jgi:DNA-binding transcriptional ArsR family regulator